MILGEKYRVKPVFSVREAEQPRVMVGTVVYIHPKRRYAVLEFPGLFGCVRESFWPEQLTCENMVKKKGRR